MTARPADRNERIARFLRVHWDRVAGWAAVVVGGAALVAGWLGASGSTSLADQLPYVLSGGLGGLFLLGVGATLLVIAELRDLWSKLDEISRARGRSAGTALATHPDRGNGARVSSARSVVAAAHGGVAAEGHVVGPGMTKYHRPDCILVQGKEIEPYEPRDAGDRSRPVLDPCPMCSA